MCDVCNRTDREDLGVASSSLGPISLAFCRECLDNHAEPEWLIHQCYLTDNWRVRLENFGTVIHYFKDGVYKPANTIVVTDEEKQRFWKEFEQACQNTAQSRSIPQES